MLDCVEDVMVSDSAPWKVTENTQNNTLVIYHHSVSLEKLRDILENKKLTQHQKTRVFDMCVLPVMTYGSQTWAMTKRNMDRLIRTQRAMERIKLHMMSVQ